MNQRFTLLTICLATTSFALQASAQQLLPSPALPQTLAPVATAHSTPMAAVVKGTLPDDLPQAKLLFIKYLPIDLPPEGPTGWGQARSAYFMKKNHNKVIDESNKQLREATARYPYAHRTTTLDSVAYYRDHLGYKYMLMQSSFNAVADGTFTGTTGNGVGANRTYNHTKVALYLEDLTSSDRFVFNDFSETFIYYYKGQIEMLMKKIDKQFNARK